MKLRKYIIVILQVVLTLVFLFSAYKILEWFFENEENNKLLKETQVHVEETVVEVDNEVKNILNVDFESLRNINDDTVAYLKINNTLINHPVVQTSDNDFYLTNSFNKTYNSAGWLFADYKNILDGSDKNIIIYGHNRKDDSMFGTLVSLLDEDYYSTNNIIQFVTDKGYFEYQIFSVYTINAEEYYLNTSFIDNEYLNFIMTLNNRSLYDFNLNLSGEDKIITLSTCNTDSSNRIVVHAKLFNEVLDY